MIQADTVSNESMINIYTLLSKAFFVGILHFLSSLSPIAFHASMSLGVFAELFFSYSHSENCYKNHSLLGM